MGPKGRNARGADTRARLATRHDGNAKNAAPVRACADIDSEIRRTIIGKGSRSGVDDGDRTHDHRSHNPGLYH
jgi:hypothetical protein